jgi:hypothetical protein
LPDTKKVRAFLQARPQVGTGGSCSCAAIGEELVMMLSQGKELAEALRAKVNAAIIHKAPLHRAV